MSFERLLREPECICDWSLCNQVAEVLVHHVDAASWNAAGNGAVELLAGPQSFLGTLTLGNITVRSPFSRQFAILHNADHIIEKDQFTTIAGHFMRL